MMLHLHILFAPPSGKFAFETNFSIGGDCRRWVKFITRGAVSSISSAEERRGCGNYDQIVFP